MRISIAVMALLLLPGLGPVEAADRSAGDAAGLELLRGIPELAWHASSGDSDCSVTCWDQHVSGMHVAANGGNTNERAGGSHSDALPGSCEDNHPGCGEHEHLALARELGVVIDAGDIESLMLALKQTTNVYFAPERGAIQVLGCDQEVVAHLALPATLMTVLAQQ